MIIGSLSIVSPDIQAVKFHLKNIRRKLGTPTIIAAILTAQRLGLIEI
jgi:DNA-binding CsgD family transcriptional regulator